jgi:hypothetical protein
VIVAIHQPQFMPWLGYFDKMDQADAFVLLDNVQYKKNEWQNRNRIRTAQGKQWLTVPVRFKFPALINQVGINNEENWRNKHWQVLRTNYAKAPYWESVHDDLQAFYQRPCDMLTDLNQASVTWLKQQMGIATELYLASEMELSQEPTQRLVDICKSVGAKTYLAGADGAKYMELELFAEAGLEILFQEYEHPTYPQLFDSCETHLSALDLVLNCGPASLETVRRGRRN